eukprot:COSAG04_NODE_10013_length_813_cov_0.721289_1_plen_97_part_10
MRSGGAAGGVAGAAYHAGEVAVGAVQELFDDGRPAPRPAPRPAALASGSYSATDHHTESELARKKRTVWCGGIPAELATDAAIAQQMECVGAVESVT